MKGHYRPYAKKLLFIALANVICSIAFNGFLIPNHLLSGGAGGIAIMIHYLSDLPTSLLVVLINLPLFLLGGKFVDKEFAINSFISMIFFSLFLSLTNSISQYIVIGDRLVETVFGGLLNGIGMAILFKQNSSQGGADIVAAIVRKKLNVPIATVLMSINAIIITLSSFIFDLQTATFTLIGLFVAYRTLDRVLKGMNPEQNCMIISDKSDEISAAIIKDLNRSATLVSATGAFSHTNKQIIYCTLKNMEIGKLKHLLASIDPAAFVTITDLTEVRGGGFKAQTF